MLDYKEYHKRLKQTVDETRGLYDSIDLSSQKKKLIELQDETQKEELWKDKARMALVNQEIGRIKRKVEPWDMLLKELSETDDLMTLAIEDDDESLLAELCDKIDGLEKRFRQLEVRELLSEEDDPSNCFIIIHPGAGGTESQDWANMLYRMYYRWAEDKGFSIDVIDYTPGDEAGIKSATLLIHGDYGFGLLKGEKGVHRLVRISPFDANKRRHTSFASVEVMPEISEDIIVDIKEADLRIDTYRASGAGGQHVNRTDSAVRITHLPTGIVVQCQNERSQHKNKSSAMKVLRSRLYELFKKEQEIKKLEKSGQKKDISWGNQIRSYVFQPYTLVKDHRTGEETGNVEKVFDGDIDRFIQTYLKLYRSQKS